MTAAEHLARYESSQLVIQRDYDTHITRQHTKELARCMEDGEYLPKYWQEKAVRDE